MGGITITTHEQIVEFCKIYRILLPEFLRDDFFDLTIGRKHMVFIDEELLSILKSNKEKNDAEDALLSQTLERNIKGIEAERTEIKEAGYHIHPTPSPSALSAEKRS